MTPLSLVLLRHQPGPTTVSQPSALTSDSYANNSTRWLRLDLQCKINALQPKNNFQLEKQGAQYKRHYDAKAHVEPDFVSRNGCSLKIPHRLVNATQRLRLQKPATASYRFKRLDHYKSSKCNRSQPCSTKRKYRKRCQYTNPQELRAERALTKNSTTAGFI